MQHPSPKALGHRIRSRREQVGLSASELARRAGVTRDTLAAWEAGQSEPRANKLMMLAGVLGTNVAWLLEGDAGHCGPNPEPGSDVASLREQLGQAQGLAENLTHMLTAIQRRIDKLESEQRHG